MGGHNRLRSVHAVVWLAFVRFIENDAPQRAGAIAFSALLSLFPFVLFLGWLAGFLASVDAVKRFSLLRL